MYADQPGCVPSSVESVEACDMPPSRRISLLSHHSNDNEHSNPTPKMATTISSPVVMMIQSFLCSGLPLRGVEAMSSSSFSDMDSYIDLDAPFKSLTLVSLRLSDNAAPAAFCCAFDLAGIA